MSSGGYIYQDAKRQGQGTKLRLNDTVANAPKFIMLVTEIQKLVATLATRTLQVPYILLLCICAIK